jgi:hypothetical protein
VSATDDELTTRISVLADRAERALTSGRGTSNSEARRSYAALAEANTNLARLLLDLLKETRKPT